MQLPSRHAFYRIKVLVIRSGCTPPTHCFATGGAFNNGMPFSLSMGCGSWGGNSIDDNLHWKHFMQTAKIVREIPSREPALDDIFADYWKAAGA